MSLNEYNHHATLGPLAGPATTAASMAGQEAFKRAHEPPPPPTGDGAPLSRKAMLGIALGVVLLATPWSWLATGGFAVGGLLILLGIGAVAVGALRRVMRRSRRRSSGGGAGN
jgi:hypothetical protein